MNHREDRPTPLDACLMEIRKADESVRTTTRRLGELRRARAHALDDNEPDRVNT